MFVVVSAPSYNFTRHQTSSDVLKANATSDLGIEELEQNDWIFRVAAENEYGQGEFSEASKSLNDAEPLALLTETAEMAIVIAIGCVGVFMLMLAVYGCFLGEFHS